MIYSGVFWLAPTGRRRNRGGITCVMAYGRAGSRSRAQAPGHRGCCHGIWMKADCEDVKWRLGSQR